MEYFAGYLLEKSLAIDNVFVWLMIFAAFAIPVFVVGKAINHHQIGLQRLPTPHSSKQLA
jgi:tellurite resistance protein TerC